MGHYLRFDRRIKVIKDIISPFQLQLNKIMEICKKNGNWYWDIIFADDMEHHVGTAFIILQNYINSSISDLFPDLSDLYTKYSFDKKVNNTKTTRIELIIAIANYYKHRDLTGELGKYTVNTLNDLKIEFKEIFEDGKFFHKVGSSSPVFEGLSLLSESWEFNDLINIVSEWRENMWLNEEKNLCPNRQEIQ